MKILAVDVGTGTQDILLFDSRLDVENSYKLVLPSPTLQIRKRLNQATCSQRPVLLQGVMMGGGPSGWGARDHIQAGFPVYATPEAGKTFNDDLDVVREMGVTLVSEDEAAKLPESVLRIDLMDFEFDQIQRALDEFGVRLDDLSAIAVAVFDHGAAPPDVSDRQFRFEYLDRRIRENGRLSAFAYLSDQIPDFLTRLKAVAISAKNLPCPLVAMDTAPAAVLGATLDPIVADRAQKVVVNIGNLHSLAFRLGPAGIEGVFEHHTGMLDQNKMELLLQGLADGSLSHQDVFNSHGHGALIFNPTPLQLDDPNWNIAVTGPRRRLMQGSRLGSYFAVPYGDMMMAGCFGLLAAAADLLPEMHSPIWSALSGKGSKRSAPWEI